MLLLHPHSRKLSHPIPLHYPPLASRNIPFPSTAHPSELYHPYPFHYPPLSSYTIHTPSTTHPPASYTIHTPPLPTPSELYHPIPLHYPPLESRTITCPLVSHTIKTTCPILPLATHITIFAFSTPPPPSEWYKLMLRSYHPVKSVNWSSTPSSPPPEVGEFLYLPYDLDALHLGVHRDHHLHRLNWTHH